MLLLSFLNIHWRRLFTARIQQRAAWVLVVVGLLPFIVLSIYSHPALDDFNDALLRERLGFWESQRNLYLTWTGRFTTSVFLTELSPLYYHWLNHYWLVPIGAMLALLLGLYALLSILTGPLWNRTTRLLASGIILLLWLLRASSVAEVLYWFNGVAVYTLPTAMLLFWLTAVLCYWQAPRNSERRWLSAVVLIGVALIGCNELLALGVLAVLGLLTVREVLQKGKRRYMLLAALFVISAALALSFLAPGNMQRAQTIGRNVPLYWVALGSICSSVYMLLNWLSNGVLLATTALALPALSKLVAAPCPHLRWVNKIHPAVLVFILLLLLILTGLPSYWATGGMMPPRARAMIYFVFILGWFLLVLATLMRWQPAANSLLAPYLLNGRTWPARLSALFWLWLLVYLATDHNVRLLHEDMGQGSNNSIVAYRDWFSGDAHRYDAEQTWRYRFLTNTKDKRVQVPPLQASPPSLLYYDITTDSTYWGNVAYARYFGKNAVWVGPGGLPPTQ